MKTLCLLMAIALTFAQFNGVARFAQNAQATAALSAQHSD